MKWKWWWAQKRPDATSMTCWRTERCWLRRSTTSNIRWKRGIALLPKSGWEWRFSALHHTWVWKCSAELEWHRIKLFEKKCSSGCWCLCSVGPWLSLNWRTRGLWKHLWANRWRTWRQKLASGERRSSFDSSNNIREEANILTAQWFRGDDGWSVTGMRRSLTFNRKSLLLTARAVSNSALMELQALWRQSALLSCWWLRWGNMLRKNAFY